MAQEILFPPCSCQTQVCVRLCCCCHLRDTFKSCLPTSFPSSSHTHAHREKNTHNIANSFSRAYSLSLLPAPGVNQVVGPGLSPYGGFWSHAQFDFPSASLIKSSWTFLWRWERRREKNKGGREELLPNFSKQRHTVPDKPHKTCPPVSSSIFPSLAYVLSFYSSKHSRLEK